MTTELPGQRPEGKLLQDALRADGRSIRQVAKLAGISDARWRQLVKGSLSVGGEHTTEQVAPPATLARMAYVVGVTPDQLTQVGREDAAALLVKLQQSADSGTSVLPLTSTVDGSPADEIDLIYDSASMTDEQKIRAIQQVLRLRANVEAKARAEAKKRASVETPKVNDPL